mmetsp:Transcript_16619/g.62950  ORF Transcript_16619/g.62950 Transcript_16619/m.62950 type:complete len:211 (+) Transcript_16619:6470-7102(+)
MGRAASRTPTTTDDPSAATTVTIPEVALTSVAAWPDTARTTGALDSWPSMSLTRSDADSSGRESYSGSRGAATLAAIWAARTAPTTPSDVEVTSTYTGRFQLSGVKVSESGDTAMPDSAMATGSPPTTDSVAERTASDMETTPRGMDVRRTLSRPGRVSVAVSIPPASTLPATAAVALANVPSTAMASRPATSESSRTMAVKHCCSVEAA